MSTTTDVLSLFKYDPVADADSTFNITQALNNNWDKLDAAILLAIAAAEAYNPEESYAVGDYCTYKGKLRKCSTAIPTGEAWTEAHWTTTTVAAEMAELSSQLSNRLLIHANNAAGIDCNLLIEDGRYQIQSPNILNAPPGIDPTYGHFFIDVFHHMDNWVRQIAYEVNSTRIYTRARLAGSWSQWEPIATATPPQEFDLPLAEEMQPLPDYGSNKYWKNQFNEVTLTISVTKTDMTTNDIPNGAVLATLPAGFRPLTPVSGAAFNDRGADDNVYPSFIIISPDGSIRLFQAKQVPCYMVVASISFVAAT